MTIRNILKKKRLEISLEQQNFDSEKIAAQVIHTSEFKTAQHIACYLPMPGEAHTQPIITAIWNANKYCYLPIVTKQSLQFIRFTPTTKIHKNKLGFSQPENKSEIIAPEELDLVITPLVGFDDHCNRLGMGGGHYDRTFAFLNITDRPIKPFLLGIAYEMQQVTEVEKQIWDVTLNQVITPTKIFKK